MPQVLLQGSRRDSFDSLPCSFESLGSGKNALRCTVDSSFGNSTAAKIQGVRPSICEFPGVADKYAMGQCKYQFDKLQGCGCPTLDPNAHPEVWAAYRAKALSEVRRQSSNKTHLTLTFFASGYLLQDCKLLAEVLQELGRKNWMGQVNVQFIDLKYAASRVEKEASSNGISGYKAGAAVFGVAGVASLAFACTQKNKEKQRNFQIAGGVSVIIAVILLILEQSQELEGDLSQRDVEEIKMSDSDAFGAIGSFLTHIKSHLPGGVNLDTTFFGHSDDCIRNGVKTDVLLGYDIDGGEPLDSLRRGLLTHTGQTVVVGKSDKPIMFTGGKNDTKFKISDI